MDNHTIYTASVRQLNGLIAERDALASALAAKQEQVAGLVVERDELRELLAASYAIVAFNFSSVRGEGPKPMEDVGGPR